LTLTSRSHDYGIRGAAKVGAQEFEVRPGTAFIAQKGVPHQVKKAPGSKAVKVLWSHGAV